MTRKTHEAVTAVTADAPATAPTGQVVQLAEQMHTKDQARARGARAGRRTPKTPQPKAAHPSNKSAPGKQASVGPTPSASTPPITPSRTTHMSQPRGFAATLKKIDAFLDRTAGFIGRRALDMAPGIAIGEVAHRAFGVSRRVAYPVGAAVSQLAAAGVDYGLRDKTLAPEAADARRAFERIVAALSRGNVTISEVHDDLVSAGWSHDVASALVAKAQGLTSERWAV